MLALALPALAAAGDVVPAAGNDPGATTLLATIAAVLVALIGAAGSVLAVRAARNSSSAGDPVAGLLARVYADVDALHVKLDEARAAARLWRARAERHGWKPGDP